MIALDRTLVGREQPAVEQAGDAIDAGEHFMGKPTGCDVALVAVGTRKGALVGLPAESPQARLDVCGQNRREQLRGRVGRRQRPKPFGFLRSIATPTRVFSPGVRPPLPPGRTPPSSVSSISTTPQSRSRPSRTIAWCRRCSIDHAVWYEPNASTRLRVESRTRHGRSGGAAPRWRGRSCLCGASGCPPRCRPLRWSAASGGARCAGRCGCRCAGQTWR